MKYITLSPVPVMNAFEKKIATQGGYIFENGEHRYRSAFTPEPLLFVPALAIIALIVWWGVHQATDWYWIAFPSLVAFVAGGCVSWRFTIEPSNSVMRKQAFWFGRRVIKERLVPLSEFKFLLVERGNASGEDGIVFKVNLQHDSGRKTLLRYYHTPRPAEELAWRISCDTGIKLKDEKN